jgi:hypothetical protein
MASDDPHGNRGSSADKADQTDPAGHPADSGDAAGDPVDRDVAADRPPDSADALRRLEQRLDAASEAAERLLADATARATGNPPPAGWQQRRPDAEHDGGGLLGNDADLLLGLLVSLRDRIPPELQRRLAEAVREVLLALRALIDWYLERTERRAAKPAEVQDIPIL